MNINIIKEEKKRRHYLNFNLGNDQYAHKRKNYLNFRGEKWHILLLTK